VTRSPSESGVGEQLIVLPISPRCSHVECSDERFNLSNETSYFDCHVAVLRLVRFGRWASGSLHGDQIQFLADEVPVEMVCSPSCASVSPYSLSFHSLRRPKLLWSCSASRRRRSLSFHHCSTLVCLYTSRKPGSMLVHPGSLGWGLCLPDPNAGSLGYFVKQLQTNTINIFVSVCPSVPLSAWNSGTSTGRIFFLWMLVY
jgi:hypothetical protein